MKRSKLILTAILLMLGAVIARAEPAVRDAGALALDRLEVIESSDVPVGRGPFDVVVANISAATITAMASELDAMAPPGGLVLTGVLDRQASTVTEAFGRPLVVTASRDGWSLLQG